MLCTAVASIFMVIWQAYEYTYTGDKNSEFCSLVLCITFQIKWQSVTFLIRALLTSLYSSSTISDVKPTSDVIRDVMS